MASDSMKYFFDRNDDLSINQIVGYFDFSNTGISGLLNIPTEIWTSGNTSLQILDLNNFWQHSGFASFDKNNYAKLNHFSGDSLSVIFAYELSEQNSDNIFLASSDYVSGINFGINHAGYPYLEYVHKIYGPITICHNIKANKTGVINFSINGENSASIGLFNAESNSFEKVFASLDENFKKSNNYYIGGNERIETGRFLSAKIGEIFIYSPDYISSNIFENEFVSGIVSSIVVSNFTGIISGQTGILNGNIIEITQCSVQASGVLEDIVLSTGSGEYFATHESFLDFNNETFNKFFQQNFIEYFSGYSTGENYFLVCSDAFTAKNLFEYDSGYSVRYSITNTTAFLSKPQYIYKYHNAISLYFNMDGNDILSIYGYSGTNIGINFSDIYYINADNSYGYNNEIGEDFSGFYYNGQLQTRSSGYLEFIGGGFINYVPSQDYFISGNKILSNSQYGNLEENNSLIDFWPKSNFLLTGNILSGESVSNLNFDNSFIFLNGQLLNSGIDYSGTNTMLINITGNDNILTVQNNILGLNGYIFKNITGFYFEVPFNFNKKTSLVWLNGQRLYLNRDYVELGANDKMAILTANTGVIIYGI